jgi:4-hydroxythreonine-4-phosphate dehydrogenase
MRPSFLHRLDIQFSGCKSRVKLLGFRAAVTVVVGLPIVRTSVAHGTAYDIAGKGVADPSTMVEAIKVAAQLAAAKRG